MHVVYDDVPSELHAPASHKRVKWVFLTSIAHTEQAAFEAYRRGQYTTGQINRHPTRAVGSIANLRMICTFIPFQIEGKVDICFDSVFRRSFQHV